MLPFPTAPMLGALGETLARVAEPWQSAYSDSKVLSTVVTFAHVGGLLVGGGLALAADRATLRGVRAEAGERALRLADLGATHAPVVGALGLVLLSGVALLLSDVETYWGSPVFWVKMALVALLLANGALMTRAERALRDPHPDGGPAWRRLHTHALASMALWLVTTLLGVVLLNL